MRDGRLGARLQQLMTKGTLCIHWLGHLLARITIRVIIRVTSHHPSHWLGHMLTPSRNAHPNRLGCSLYPYRMNVPVDPKRP